MILNSLLFDDDDDDDDDDDELFFAECLTEERCYFLPELLSKFLAIANLRHAASRIRDHALNDVVSKALIIKA